MHAELGGGTRLVPATRNERIENALGHLVLGAAALVVTAGSRERSRRAKITPSRKLVHPGRLTREIPLIAGDIVETIE